MREPVLDTVVVADGELALAVSHHAMAGSTDGDAS
jgi:hypothetical protein